MPSRAPCLIIMDLSHDKEQQSKQHWCKDVLLIKSDFNGVLYFIKTVIVADRLQGRELQKRSHFLPKSN